ncbi:MAG: hypothetical protein AAGM04_12410, partial [Pseudomonadota bacterium]
QKHAAAFARPGLTRQCNAFRPSDGQINAAQHGEIAFFGRVGFVQVFDSKEHGRSAISIPSDGLPIYGAGGCDTFSDRA